MWTRSSAPAVTAGLRVVAVITERQSIDRILAHLGVDPPLLARARDPNEGEDVPDLLDLGFLTAVNRALDTLKGEAETVQDVACYPKGVGGSGLLGAAPVPPN